MNEHPDDSDAVTNERVKGSLKVTRAFGAGFLKQVIWFLYNLGTMWHLLRIANKLHPLNLKSNFIFRMYNGC